MTHFLENIISKTKRWSLVDWEDRKDFTFLLLYLVGSRKVQRQKKMSLYKFTHMFLIKNEVQLKKKKRQTTTKKAIIQIYY